MKTMIRLLISGAVALVLESTNAFGQKVDEERMKRDIEVAENVLGTLIKQQFNNQRTFFPLEIRGSYQSGYGVTFMLPADFTTPIAFSITEGSNVVVWGSEPQGFYLNDGRNGNDAVKAADSQYKLKEKAKEKKAMNMDSIRDAYNQKVIDAAKTFIVDYGDMITQLGAQEKLVVTNQGNQPRMWVNQYFNAPKRTHLSIEAQKSDLTQLKQGKIGRDEALAKVKVINTESVDTVEPDLELLSSIFNRLYRPDLSKTYFTEGNIYYERLKDFGVIFYMPVFSSDERDYKRYVMPTIGLDNVDEATRDKKATELYPRFDQELRDNILEYGRTLKSLKDEEVLVFQVRMTRCPGCGIPSTVEYTVKGSALKDYGAGKIDKKAALAKLSIKKGPEQ